MKRTVIEEQGDMQYLLAIIRIAREHARIKFNNMLSDDTPEAIYYGDAVQEITDVYGKGHNEIKQDIAKYVERHYNDLVERVKKLA